MSLRNLVRIIGVPLGLAIIIAIPQLFVNIVMYWFPKNLIIMVVLLAADVIIGFYLLYLDVRYVIVQLWRK